MASPTFFGEGSTPRVTDTRWRILQKILGATIDGGGGGIPGASFMVILANHAALPPVPPDPTKIWFYSFRDGTASAIWDPGTLGYL